MAENFGKQEDIATNQIRYWRKRHGVSLGQLSARIEVNGRNFASAKTLNRWEKGETRMPEWAVPEIAHALKVSEEELLFGPREANPVHPVSVSVAYTGLDVEIAASVVNLGYTSWIASRPDDARKAVQSVMPWLEAALRRAPRSSQERWVRRTLARGHELIGALSLDALQNDLAQAHFRSALTLSEELGDSDFIAAHMTQLGDAYRRQGDKETALDLMNAALGWAQHAERATRGYVEEMIAYTYADVGDLQGFERHIGEAVHLLGHSGEGEGAAQREFIPFEILEITGKAMRDFGKPLPALDYLECAQAALVSRPKVPRWHAVLTISKAQALCDAGELEAGVELAIRGITLAHSCQSPRQMNRVRKLMRKLDQSPAAAAPAVAPLREIVRDIYSGNLDPLQWHPVHSM